MAKSTSVALTNEQEEELWLLARRESIEARNILIGAYHGFAKTVFFNMVRRGEIPVFLIDQLRGAEMNGLIEAIRGFDGRRPFKIYARIVIRSRVKDAQREFDLCGRTVRRKLNFVKKHLRNGENPVVELDELHRQGKAMHIRQEDLVGINGFLLVSIDDLLEKGRGEKCLTFAEIIPSGEETPEQILERKEFDAKIRTLIDQLPPKEQTVVRLYYYEELTLVEIGKRMHLSEGRISQLHIRAKRQLCRKIRSLLNKSIPGHHAVA